VILTVELLVLATMFACCFLGICHEFLLLRSCCC